jgi:hypothetical protein
LTQQSEAKTGTPYKNSLLKGVTILLLVIVIIVGSIFAIGAFWASHQQQQAQNIINGLIPTYSPPTPTPSIWTLSFRTDIYHQRPPNVQMSVYSNSQTSITFSANDILYNGRSAESYGVFAPQLLKIQTGSPISEFTFNYGYFNGIKIYFPRGTGSPWNSGVSVQMSITTNNAQGSTTFNLP